jgi:hypothetical protein
VHRGDASSYVEFAILIPPEQENSSNGLEERSDKTEGRKPLLDALQLFGIS